MITVKYTRRADYSGWLTVQLTRTGQRVGLCEYTKVEIAREAQGRVYFKIADGNSEGVGQEASLHKENAQKYLSDVGPKGAAMVWVRYTGEPAWENSPFKGHLLQQWGVMSVNGTQVQVTLNSTWEGDTRHDSPISPGTYTIFTPNFSRVRISTGGYVQATAGMHGNNVWFPVGSVLSTDRFIHVGHLSEGCITTHELTKWNAVYDYLISKREPSSMGKHIGKVIVQK